MKTSPVILSLKTEFMTDLDYEVRSDKTSYLVKPLRFFSHRFNRAWEAPKDFPTDRASAEVFGWKLIGKSERPWVAHDYLFATGEVGLFGAALILYDLLRSEGNGKAASVAFTSFATLHPKAVESYRAHRRGNTPATKFLRLLSGNGHSSVENHP